MRNDFDMTRIAGTLRYGLLDESKHFLLAAVLGFVVLVGGIAAGIVAVAVNMANGVLSTDEGVGGNIGLVAGGGMFCFILLRYIIRNVNHRKAFLPWLDDAVELKAFARKAGESCKYDLYENKKFTIRVVFKYNGNRCKYTSSAQSCWRDYADKPIDILYSPKFHEVIILKPDNRK